MLTRVQRDLMLFIQDTIDEEGVAPSYDEMTEHSGLKGRATVHRAVQILKEKGFIDILAKRHRAVEVIRRIERTPRELAALEVQKHEAEQ